MIRLGVADADAAGVSHLLQLLLWSVNFAYIWILLFSLWWSGLESPILMQREYLIFFNCYFDQLTMLTSEYYCFLCADQAWSRRYWCSGSISSSSTATLISTCIPLIRSSARYVTCKKWNGNETCRILDMLNKRYIESSICWILNICRIIEMSNPWYVESLICRILAMWYHLYVESLICRTLNMSNH